MPSAMIDNLNDALTLVETAGADNGGLIIDIAHLFNKGTVLEELKRLPLKYIVNVELNDGFLPDSPRHDPSGARRFCGVGEFDIKGFIKCLIQMGYDGPWAVEIFSDEVLKMPLEEINRKAFATTIEQFNI